MFGEKVSLLSSRQSYDFLYLWPSLFPGKASGRLHLCPTDAGRPGGAAKKENVMQELEHWRALLHVVLGHRAALDAVPDGDAWRALYAEACRQSVAAVFFTAVERLPKEQRPPRPLLLEWMARTRQVELFNRSLDGETDCILQRLRRDGVPAVLLKGRGVAHYYPDPNRRMTGDIDLWLGMTLSDIADYARSNGNKARRYGAYSRGNGAKPRATCLHVELPFSTWVKVEAHATPSFRYAPLANRRLQRWFAAQAAAQFSHHPAWAGPDSLLRVPTDRFNGVYLLLHLYRHYLSEGVGLRHLMDYYYLLVRGGLAGEAEAVATDLRFLGLARFAGAVMYVLTDLFGLPAELCPVAPDAVRGRALLADVRLAGNFGRADLRYGVSSANLSRPARFARKCRRLVRFVADEPAEALSVPPFCVLHYCWRRWKGYV